MAVAIDNPIWEKVNQLERIDHDGRYMAQIAKFTREELATIFSDWRLYRRAFVWVLEMQLDGAFRPVRFTPRPWQTAYEGLPTNREFPGVRRTNFDLFLKSRKTGCTTDVETENYAKAATHQHHIGWFISFEESVAIDAGKILKTAQELNPFAPELSKNNNDGMVFKTTKSSIAIRTAGARVLARGLNLNLLHMTEVSHFYKSIDDAPSFMAGVLDAVGRGGRVVEETTANGEDPIFHAGWQHGKDGELWNPIFLSVFTDETVDWPAEHPEVLKSTANETFSLSEYERGLIDSAGASRGHIRFLRYEKQKLNSRSPTLPTSALVVGDEKMLLQEYPVDDISCFLTSADTVFEPAIVKQLKLRARPPLWIEDSGALHIWERPQVGRPYVLFLDTSEGLPTSDWQAALVLDPEKLRYVARLRMKRDWPEVAKAVADLALMYNEALLMVERNNGGTTVLYILENQLNYPNLYYHDESGFTKQQLVGWKTDGVTKPIMVAQFKEALEAGALDIPDEETLYEIGQYRYIAQVKARSQDKYQAPSGGHDDLVIAAMGAYQGRYLAYVATQAKPVRYGEYWNGE